MTKINIEIDEKYQEHLDLIKELIPDAEGNPITDNGKMVEGLIDSFVAFLQEQAEAQYAHEHAEDGSCCGGH